MTSLPALPPARGQDAGFFRRPGRGFFAFSRAAFALASELTLPPFFPILDRYRLRDLGMSFMPGSLAGWLRNSTLDLAKPVG